MQMNRPFHVREDVAPLKLAVLAEALTAAQAFHVREDVAPLKPRLSATPGNRKPAFPRS